MRCLILLALLIAVAVGVAQTPAISVKTLMTASEFDEAGLNKLSKEEIAALDKWLIKTLVDVAQRSRAASPPPTNGSTSLSGTYPVDAAVNDETFIINGEVFKAKTYCFNVNKGDRVRFVEGSASGACASARFLNMRTGDLCNVWCE